MEKRNQDDQENQKSGNRNQNDSENKNQGQPRNQGQPGNQNQGQSGNQYQGQGQGRTQGSQENQGFEARNDEFETQNQGPSGTRNQGQSGMQGQSGTQGQFGTQNQGQSGNNIGQWQAWAEPEGNTTHLHVKGTIPTDGKNKSFSLKQASSQGTSKSQLVLEIDNEGINPSGKEMSAIREFDLPITGAQKYDSVVIKSKGMNNNIATIPITQKNKTNF
jgi:hypothetical protein